MSATTLPFTKRQRLDRFFFFMEGPVDQIRSYESCRIKVLLSDKPPRNPGVWLCVRVGDE